MFCTKCGQEIKTDVKFCIKCGNPVIIENTLNNVSTVNSEPIQAKYCISCGTQINENTKFCTKCGTTSKKPQNINNQVVFKQLSKATFLSKIPLKQKILLIAGTLFAVFLIIGFIGFIPFVDIMAINDSDKLVLGRPIFISNKGKYQLNSFASGNHLYFTESVEQSKGIKLKNGQLIPRIGMESSLFISGNDVYTVGNEGILDKAGWDYIGYEPYYTKNGQKYFLQNPDANSTYAYAYLIYVFDTTKDIQILGAYKDSSNNKIFGTWNSYTNFTFSPFPFRDSMDERYSYFQSGNYSYYAGINNVFQNGSVIETNPFYATMDPRGDVQTVLLPNIRNTKQWNDLSVHSIYVFNDNVYVSGCYYRDDRKFKKYVLWKDNKIIKTYTYNLKNYGSTSFIIRRNLFSLLMF